MERGEFELVPPPEPVARRAPARRPSGIYSAADHQWLINTCVRFMTLAQFRQIARRRAYFADYTDLLKATVIYMGVVELGWSKSSLQRPFEMSRETVRQMVGRVEDLLTPGGVIDRIAQIVRAYRDGL